ncbi:MAG: Rne/Rng family ribonuclease [Bdellovibrionota bacterium]
MASQLLINVSPGETRVALVSAGRLVEAYVERPAERGITGNLYKGKVERVLPGMQAAFLDIGLDKAAFLYAGDAVWEEGGIEFDGENAAPRPAPRIQDVVRRGEEILVQVAKEPLGSKGPRVTTQVSLPGRYLVYFPNLGKVGISRRIESADERARLRALAEKLRDGTGGFVLRTLAEGVSEEELSQEASFLSRLWSELRDREKATPAGNLVHEDLALPFRAARDLATEGLAEIVVDDPSVREKLERFLSAYDPELARKIQPYASGKPLFDHYGVEVDLQRLFSRKVFLPSGGHIVVDSSEALTAVDVNTGRFVGKRDFEETALKTNLEAAVEVARQLRLRNVGGIVVVDFIDMQQETSRTRVREALLAALREDRAKTTVTAFSDLGMIELTRKRLREPLLHSLLDSCPYCDGRGRVRSAASVAGDVLRQLAREPKAKAFRVHANPEVTAYLQGEGRAALEEAEKQYGKIALTAESSFHRERFEVKKG